MRPCYVLGVNFRPQRGHEIGHDPAAVLLRDGHIVAMAEEERFVRIKEAPGLFPLQAVQFCLKKGGIGIGDVAAVGWNWDPCANAGRSMSRRGLGIRTGARAARFALRHTKMRRFSASAPSELLPEEAVRAVRGQLQYWVGLLPQTPLMCFDHHLAHAASAYFPSGFERATVISWDAWGDLLSGMVVAGDGQKLEVVDVVPFHRYSIGYLLEFVHEFLRTSEKGNLMGLAAYGSPQGLLDAYADPESMTMRMDMLAQKSPYPAEFLGRAGPPRRTGDPIEERHKNLAADLQRLIERFGLKIVSEAVRRTGCRNLCLAGGVALNATLNGQIGRSGLVDRLFIQPAAGDSGGALGAAYLAYQRLGHDVPRQDFHHAYWGPSFTNDEILEQLETAKVESEVLSDADVADVVSDCLAEQKVVGWFQGGSEWGPRALGARSILGDPRHESVKEQVNRAVKYRDWWRPFAPSMLAEAAGDFLEEPFDAPFMLSTFPVKPALRRDVAGVVHVDGTTRPQMLHRRTNPLYYDTISRFAKKSGVPMVLNTSFNLKGEPLVNSPRDAIRTFFSSGLDVLVLGNVLVRKARSAGRPPVGSG